MEERLKKWRLILGSKADSEMQDSLDEVEQGMNDVLDALYDSERDRGLGDSSPSVNRWLGDIRTYFPTPVVQLLQKDALERLGLEEMLLEPELLEGVEPDVELVSTLLSLHKVLPDKTRETAREVVNRVVQQLVQKLRNPLREAVQGSLNKNARKRRPKMHEIDWPKTIRANLRHYQPDYQTIIPQHLIGYGRRMRKLKQIILLVDQSGSMAASVVYAGVIGSIIASLPSIKTHLIVFDTSVVDLSDQLHDPVELLFATQLGGGTYIAKAAKYAARLVRNPAECLMILISDLMEGGSEQELLQTLAGIRARGVQLIGLLALNDKGVPVFDRSIASKIAPLGIPAFGCTPNVFPEVLAAALNEEDIRQWLGKHNIPVKN